jgi:hypothetical protein
VIKHIVTLVLLTALLAIFSVVSFADVYLDCSEATDGVGSLADPKNGTTTITSESASEDIYIAQGATCVGAAGVYGADSAFIILNWSGTAADPVRIKTYDAGHGTTPPVFDSRETLSSWSRYAATAIYYATTSVDDADGLAVDDIGLQEIAWNTNIATTAAAMSASTFTQDNANNLVYVWAGDGTDPSDNTVKINRTDNYIRNAWASQLAYIYLEDLIYFRGASRTSVELGGWGQDYYRCRNCKMLAGDSKFTGGRGFSLKGESPYIDNLTCSYASLMAGVDNACIVTNNSSNGEMSNLTVTDTLGSCFELMNGDTQYAWAHDIIGTNCGHGGIELYGCYNTTCQGVRNNLVERFIINNTTRVTGVYGDAFSCGIGVGNNSYNNTIRNGKLINVRWSPLSIRSSLPTAYQGHDNLFQNITIYNNTSELSGSTAGALSDGTTADDATIQGRNIFENIIVHLAAGGRIVYDRGGKNIFRNNVYYAEGGTTAPFKWDDTNYNNMTLYAAVNTVDTSIYGNPLIDLSIYAPASNSPAIGFGRANAGVPEDYARKVRSGVNDAGAVQTSDDASVSGTRGATTRGTTIR